MKKILSSLISIILAATCVITVGIGSAWFTNWNVKTWFNSWGQNEQSTSDDKNDNNDDENSDKPIDDNINDNGGTEIENFESNGVSLLSAKLPLSAYAANGIDPQADSAYMLTATIEPADASDKSVDWSVAWKDENSSFASGKSVTDYVTITPTVDGALTARAVCKQAFGEQIIITVKPRKAIGEVSATCIVNYVQKLLGVGLTASFANGSKTYGFTLSTSNLNPTIDFPVFTDGIDWEYGLSQSKYCTLHATPELSTVYTKAIELSEDYYPGFQVAATQDYLNALKAGGCTVHKTADTYKTLDGSYFDSLFFLHWGTFVSNWSGLLSSLRSNSSKVMLRIKCMTNVYDDSKPSWVYNIKFSSSSIAALAANITLNNGSIEF